MIAECGLVSRKKSKRVSKVLEQCPDIGKVIESFVQERNIGADAWRRTGVLTFDGNVRLREKVTYERIRTHLCEVYGRHFSYGTVVELCVARNKHRRSAKRYRGVAQVTTRRARKGFTLRYNPDSHWSSAFYKGLNELQYTNGVWMLNLNRDDASGFRLDTLTTCMQHPTPVVCGQETKTTRTDYVNRYPSVLQTSSYNFTGTAVTPELCAGIVKAATLHYKNPAKHAADLAMLKGKEELSPAFFLENITTHKPIDCIRVDGAMDEGPSHDEVQFWWTDWHMSRGKVATLVTTRSSGSSYMNSVELQNGCLALGHSNTFIPSTITGSCINPSTGKVDDDKVKENLDVAIDAYVSRVDGCPCGETCIHLFKGPQSDEYHLKRAKLAAFLKSKKKRAALRQSDPEVYSYFDKVWSVRNNHMMTGLPSYIFYLLCCYKAGCKHPLCIKGKQPDTPTTWYPGGPQLTQLPLPVPDRDRPWGWSSSTCTSNECAGHYSKPLFSNITECSDQQCWCEPPSVYLTL